MSEEAKVEKLEIPTEKLAESAAAEATDIITVINDTKTPVIATAGNGFLGFASMGCVLPGQKLALPVAPALWDIYVLFVNGDRIAMRWYGTCTQKIFYDRKQGNVGVGTTIHVSDMH